MGDKKAATGGKIERGEMEETSEFIACDTLEVFRFFFYSIIGRRGRKGMQLERRHKFLSEWSNTRERERDLPEKPRG